MESLGKTFALAGLFLASAGGWLWMGVGKSRSGLLPGAISIERGSFKFYFPIVTCLAPSMILAIFYRIFRR